MPLYTCVANDRGFSHVPRARRGDVQRLADRHGDLPPGAPPGSTQDIAADRRIRAGSGPVPNRERVWREVVPTGGGDPVIVAGRPAS